MKKETIESIKKALTVLLEAKKQGALMMPVEVGDRLGIPAFHAGHLFSIMFKGRQLVEKPDEKENRYRITQKGEEFLAKPPPPEEIKGEKPAAAPAAAPVTTPTTTPVTTPTTTPVTTPTTTPVTTPTTPPDKEKVVFPSQADTFSSIGERLGFEKGGVSDQKKPSLESVVEYVRSLANMDDLDSIEGVLTELGLSADVRKRWLRLYALTLPAKKAIISPELRVRLGLEEGEGKPKPPQPMYNVIEGRIYPEPDGEYTFSKAVQKVMAEKTSSDPAALITAIMPLVTKESPQPPPPADLAALITALTPLLTKESPQPPPPADLAALITALTPLLTREPPPPPVHDTTLLQSLQTRIEQLADERNKAQLDALRAEIKSGQRPPEADAQIQTLVQSIETMREESHKQELARIKEQHEATMNLLTNKLTQLEKDVQASIQGKQVDSKYGLMSDGLKGILNEIGGFRRDVKEIAPAFLQRGREKTVRTPEQKVGFDQGIEQAIEGQRKSREMEDKLFFSKES